jgi:uncharacterized protein YhbP (UPF0306 family)
MREKVLAYLAAHNVMTLATRSTWAAAVFYASQDFQLYFVSSPQSRHALDIAEEATVAAAIHEDYRDWRAIQGIQLCGRAQRLEGASRDAAMACYRRKFGFLNTITGPVLEALGRAACYRLVADELYWIDNASGFGSRTQILHRSR